MKNAEQAMMGCKASLMGDTDTEQAIYKTSNPKIIKQLGRKVKNFNQEIWDRNKEDIVYKINLAKFSQNPELRDFLLSTGDKLIVEASPYDKIWGIGLSADDPRSDNPSMWLGSNLLGKALMRVREELKNS